MDRTDGQRCSALLSCLLDQTGQSRVMSGILPAQTINLGSHAPGANRRPPSHGLDRRTTARVHRHHQAGIADKQIVVTVTVYRRDTHPAVSNVNRSEEHTSELQSLMRNSYALFCL